MRWLLVSGILVSMALIVPVARTSAIEPANSSFESTWARTDLPVADGIVSRTWTWGPDAFTGAVDEVYAESPGGMRTVQYFDKARMEITHPDADPNNPLYVSNGLLAVELISGQMQIGDNEFETRWPAQINVAGDEDDLSGPTYASFRTVLDADTQEVGSSISLRLTRAGNVMNDPALVAENVTIAYVDDGTGHGIANPFWEFMHSEAIVWENGQFVEDQLFKIPTAVIGWPVAEPYWATVKVGGVYRDVLIQCFERRCLTYNPDNPEGWQVEAGNIGQHYYDWRYEEAGKREIVFGASGDLGGNELSTTSFELLADSGAEFFLALGDLSYSDIIPEAAWCNYVQSLLGEYFPFQLVAGNHEEDYRGDGYILNFAACLPDRMGSTGFYGVEYYFDYQDLARFILISPDLPILGTQYDYADGNIHEQWVEAAIDGARAEDIPWVFVIMHNVCLSAGVSTCEIGTDLMDLMLEKNVDLILQASVHDYQRFKQLTCAEPEVYLPECVVDDGADGHYVKGEGSVTVISGAFGGTNLDPIDFEDPDFNYLAAWLGDNSPDPGRGVTMYTLTEDQVDIRFRGSTTSFTDAFTIEVQE